MLPICNSAIAADVAGHVRRHARGVPSELARPSKTQS
jgi:hypothetical protein